MDRFIALAWNAEDPDAVVDAREQAGRLRASAAGWEKAFETQGMLVLSKDAGTGRSRLSRLDIWDGVVLGTLFRGHRQGRHPESLRYDFVAELTAGEIRRAIETDGKFLIESFWGSYVVFLTNRQAGKSIVLRDPSGRVSCYCARLGGLLVYVSHVADMLQFRKFRGAINGRYLLASILVRELTIRETGLAGITELLPGECHYILRGKVRPALCWKPDAICRAREVADLAETSAALRAVTRACVTAWASRYRRILHCLSGGIDSAIVLACLRDAATTDVLCLNYHTAASDGDERPFARRAASALGFPLREVALPPADALITLLTCHPLTATPEPGVLAAPSDALMAKVASEQRATAITTGEGGDHLFFQMRTALVAADAVRAGGSLGHFVRSIAEAARWTGQAYWPVLGAALTYGLLHRNWMPEAEWKGQVFSFVRRDAVDDLPESYALHPWLEEAHGIAPGKAFQMHFLPKVLSRRKTPLGPESPDIVHPLLSQPLIELVLRIPSHVLTRGGEGRALARSAFARDVPAPILARRSKGATTSYFARMALDHLGEIRAFLLDGLLARQDFIDRKGLDMWLQERSLQHVAEIPRLFKLLATEAWLRSWSRGRPKVRN